MVKTPKFDGPRLRGTSSTGRPIKKFEDRVIVERSLVSLCYEGKTVTLGVTRVLEPQRKFEGRVKDFDNYELEHGDLKHGDLVQFSYEDIEHIHDIQDR